MKKKIVALLMASAMAASLAALVAALRARRPPLLLPAESTAAESTATDGRSMRALS